MPNSGVRYFSSTAFSATVKGSTRPRFWRSSWMVETLWSMTLRGVVFWISSPFTRIFPEVTFVMLVMASTISFLLLPSMPAMLTI